MKPFLIIGMFAMPGAATAQSTEEELRAYGDCVSALAQVYANLANLEAIWPVVQPLAESDVALAQSAAKIGDAYLDFISALADNCETLRQP